MPDREEYIDVLSKTVKTVKEYNEDAPIKISLECIEDILELLKEQEHKDRMYRALEDDWKRLKELQKEQEAVKPTWGRGKPFCGACGLRIRGGKFCSECGKPIAWEGR